MIFCGEREIWLFEEYGGNKPFLGWNLGFHKWMLRFCDGTMCLIILDRFFLKEDSDPVYNLSLT